jgi:hypothetical protein
MTHVVASPAVARPPRKPRKGEQFRMHLILPAELVDLIDRFAEELGRGGGLPWAASTTRTEAVKVLLIDGLKKRGLLK